MHFGKFTLSVGRWEWGIKSVFQKGKTGNKGQLKDDDCLDLGVTVDMEGKSPKDWIVSYMVVEGEASAFDDWLRDWLVDDEIHWQALGKEHTEVVGQEFGFTHAVLCGSVALKQIGMCTR